MCDCTEGKIINNEIVIANGLGVHDCQYIIDRNSIVEEVCKTIDPKKSPQKLREYFAAVTRLYNERFRAKQSND